MGKNFSSWPEEWPKSLTYPEVPVYAILDQTAKRVPDREAIVYNERILTYSELCDLSIRFANALFSMGIRKGDRVSICLPNCPQFAVAYYGVMRCGAVFNPLSPLLSNREAANQLRDSGAETLIILSDSLSDMQSFLSETVVKHIITTRIDDPLNIDLQSYVPENIKNGAACDMVSLLKTGQKGVQPVQINPRKDLAHLSYTGGTTGVPKGVMLTNFNVVANTLQVASWMLGAGVAVDGNDFTPDFPNGVDPLKDRIIHLDRETTIVVSPWYHALGTIRYLNNQIYQGSTIILFSKFDPKLYLKAIVKHRVTTLGGPPQLYIPLFNHPDFMNYDFSRIKYIGSGGAPLPKPLFEKMQSVFQGVVCEAYGLTECTMGAVANPPIPEIIRPGSIGIPYFDTELKVVDIVTGEDLLPGSQGEICIRGPQVMEGYYNRPDETAETLKDGWLFTGDIGYEDNDGFFYITSRKKDMIIYKGYNVYPKEIEEVILQHPAVRQCAVVGKPDQKAGEIPVAFIELQEGKSITKEEIVEFTNSRVAKYKKIRDVIFLENIPISGPGKVLKKELRKFFQ